MPSVMSTKRAEVNISSSFDLDINRISILPSVIEQRN